MLAVSGRMERCEACAIKTQRNTAEFCPTLLRLLGELSLNPLIIATHIRTDYRTFCIHSAIVGAICTSQPRRK